MGTDPDVGVSAGVAGFGTLMMLGFRESTGVAAVTVVPSAGAGSGLGVLRIDGVLILMEGAL